jgi:hypothetical protein
MTSDFGSSNWIVSLQHSQDLMVVSKAWLLSDLNIRNLSPSPNDSIFILIFGNNNILVKEITNLSDLDIELFMQLIGLFNQFALIVF